MQKCDDWYEWFLARFALGLIAIGAVATLPVWLPLLLIGSCVVWLLDRIPDPPAG